MFDQKKDGAHEISLHSIQFRGCPLYPNTLGLMRWSAGRSVELELVFEDLDGVEETEFYVPEDETNGGVGRFVDVDLSIPDWTALTDEGTQVRIYGFLGRPKSTRSSHNGRLTCKSGFWGSCSAVDVDIPTNRMLAFWNNTDCFAYRMLCIGHVGNCFHQSESVDFSDLDGSKISTCRSRIRLSNTPSVELYAANSLVCTRPAAWISYELSPAANETDWVGQHERSFLSFLNGDLVAFPFADRFVSNELISRTYFGPVRCRRTQDTSNHEPMHAPLPMFGIERFEFGNEVLSRLPQLYVEYVKNAVIDDFVAILHPIWTALNGVLDDRLALASLSIERLSSIWAEAKKQIRPEIESSTSHIWSNKPLLQGIRRELFTAVQSVVNRELVNKLQDHLGTVDLAGLDADALDDLKKVLVAKIANLTSAPNSLKLQLPFKENGMSLSSIETEALKQRNSALHGNDRGASSLAMRDEANRTFDVLRMLIGKCILKICKYEGPYIDYASRPESGNFRVEWIR